MSKKQGNEGMTEDLVEVRNVAFDPETDSAIDMWRLRERRSGRKFKRGEAVAELTKRQLKNENCL